MNLPQVGINVLGKSMSAAMAVLILGRLQFDLRAIIVAELETDSGILPRKCQF